MSKSIKVKETTYERLLALQRPRETFSDIIERMLRVYAAIADVEDTLSPGHYLMERPKADARAKETPIR